MDSKEECSSFSPQKVTDAFINSIAENSIAENSVLPSEESFQLRRKQKD